MSGPARHEQRLPPERWPGMPGAHRAFLEAALAELRREPELVGVLAAGSFAGDCLDAWSDLDLVLVAEPQAREALLERAPALAARLGRLVAVFPGDHVGERRLWIALYDAPPLHVDFKFVVPDELGERVDEPALLWARDARVAAGLAAGRAAYPTPGLQWIEDRFWPWVHYIACKIARGELFEALDGLGFLRARVLGPLVLREAGAPPSGLRRVEQAAPGRVDALRATVAQPEATACRRALDASIALYAELRDALAPACLTRRHEAERVARTFVTRELG